MARYERSTAGYETPLAYFDRKTIGDDTASRAAFAQAVAQTFPKNQGLQRALTDYARSKGRFVVDEGRVTVTERKGKKIVNIKTRVTRGANKGKTRSITLKKYLARPTVKKALDSGKKTVYLSSKGVASLKTPAQAAAYRRASKNPPALINWSKTREQGVIVFE